MTISDYENKQTNKQTDKESPLQTTYGQNSKSIVLRMLLISSAYTGEVNHGIYKLIMYVNECCCDIT